MALKLALADEMMIKELKVTKSKMMRLDGETKMQIKQLDESNPYPEVKRLQASVEQLRQALICTKADMIPLSQVIADMLRSEPVGVAHYVKALWRS